MRLDFKKINQDGFVFITAVFVVFIIGVSGMGLLELMNSTASSSSKEVQQTNAFYIGQAGLEYVKRRIDQGKDPRITNVPLNNGTFSVTAIPGSRLVTVAGLFGEASHSQTINTDYAQHVISFNTLATLINGKDMDELTLAKATTTLTPTVAKMWISWNWDSCVTSQTYNPPTNDLSGCPVSTNGASIKHISIDGTAIYNPGLGIGTPGGGGADSGQEIDVVDYSLTGVGPQTYEFVGPPHSIRFGETPPANGLYTITIEFTDSSQVSTTFQE